MKNHAQRAAYQHRPYSQSDTISLEPPSFAANQRISQRQQTAFSPPLARSVYPTQAIPQAHSVPEPVTSDYTNLASQVADLDSASEPGFEVDPLRVPGQYLATPPLLHGVITASTAQERGLEAGEAKGSRRTKAKEKGKRVELFSGRSQFGFRDKDGTVVETRPCAVM
nr:hypothetical protein B0A51_16506 [Rachicladosporium sp. CCFEE 5018]